MTDNVMPLLPRQSDTTPPEPVETDQVGVTKERQRFALEALREAEVNGLTWRELAKRLNWHHGQASSVLSTLHRASEVTRLKQRRDKSRVYVLPENVAGRKVDYPNRSAAHTMRRELGRSLEEMVEAHDCTHGVVRVGMCPACMAKDTLIRWRKTYGEEG